jgi:hypothetical protein
MFFQLLFHFCVEISDKIHTLSRALKVKSKFFSLYSYQGFGAGAFWSGANAPWSVFGQGAVAYAPFALRGAFIFALLGAHAPGSAIFSNAPYSLM